MSDEMDNLDVTPTTPSSVGGLDPLYQQMYGGGLGTGTAERQVGFPVLPRFSYYVLKTLKATRRRSKDGGNVGVQVMVEVIEGPGGTTGMKFTDSSNLAYGFIVGRMSGKQGQQVRLDDAAWQEKVDKRKLLLNRIAKTLGLALAVPSGFTDPAVDQYAGQFEKPRTFVAEVRIDKGDDGVERNRIIWESVAAVDEAVHDRNGQPTGQNALQEAREKITAFNAKAPTAPRANVSSSDLR